MSRERGRREAVGNSGNGKGKMKKERGLGEGWGFIRRKDMDETLAGIL
jgi:hypothetical protein